MEIAVIDIRSSGQRNSDVPCRAATLTVQVSMSSLITLTKLIEMAIPYENMFYTRDLLGFTAGFLFPYQRSSRAFLLTAYH